MAFRCGICDEPQPPGTVENPIVLEYKEVVHPRREHVHPVPGKARKYWKDDPGGRGVQIVSQVSACHECAENHNHLSAGGHAV